MVTLYTDIRDALKKRIEARSVGDEQIHVSKLTSSIFKKNKLHIVENVCRNKINADYIASIADLNGSYCVWKNVSQQDEMEVIAIVGIGEWEFTHDGYDVVKRSLKVPKRGGNFINTIPSNVILIDVMCRNNIELYKGLSDELLAYGLCDFMCTSKKTYRAVFSEVVSIFKIGAKTLIVNRAMLNMLGRLGFQRQVEMKIDNEVKVKGLMQFQDANIDDPGVRYIFDLISHKSLFFTIALKYKLTDIANKFPSTTQDLRKR